MSDLDQRLAHRRLLRQLRARLAKDASEASRTRELRTARLLFERGMGA
jgi:hypothetical protein